MGRGTAAQCPWQNLEHKAMRSVCEDAGNPCSIEECRAKRSPFYNKGGTPLTRTNAIDQIDLASAAFEDWRTIQAEDPRAADIMKSSTGKLTPP